MKRIFNEDFALAELEGFIFDRDDIFAEFPEINPNFDVSLSSSTYIPFDGAVPVSNITLTVTNTDTSGAGSLTQAVVDANANATTDEILFDSNLLGLTITNLPTLEITESLTIDFDIDGDDVSDIDLFFDQNNSTFLNLTADGTILTLDHGNFMVDVDEGQTTDTNSFGSFISVTSSNITLNNNSNINASGIETDRDFSDVINASLTDNFTFTNTAGSIIITTGREVVDATFGTSVTIVNDGMLIASDDTIRIGTGTITNSGLIESTGDYPTLGIPGFAADGIALLNQSDIITSNDFAVPEGPVHIMNLVTGIIDGFRSGVQFFGGGVIDNDGLISGETTAIATGSNASTFASEFLLNNTGTLTNNGAEFGFVIDAFATVLNFGGLQSITVNNSGLIDSTNFGIFTLDPAVVNNLNGGQILSDNDGTGDDGVAFYGARTEDFIFEAFVRSIDPVNGFVSSQGITLDVNAENFLLPDGSILAPNPGFIEAGFVEGIADILPLFDIAATQANGFVTLQSDANGTLYPAVTDLVSPTLGPIQVTFISGDGFTITDGNGNSVFNVPVDVDFGDVINNMDGATIDGDIMTGLGDDIVTNGGSIDGGIELYLGDDTLLLTDAGTISGDLDGGEGFDTLSYTGFGSAVTLTLDDSSITNFENIIGSQFNDVITNFSSIEISISGGSGHDRLTGGSENDILRGGADNDQLFGEAGNDLLGGDAGNDFLYGGGGNDRLIGANGIDRLFGDAGEDILDGGNDIDFLFGGDDNDTLRGGAGNDRLYGEAGDDLIGGDAGNDLAFGGDGDDTIFGANDDDRLFGQAGEDTLIGGNGIDVLLGGADSDTLIGGADNDRLFGNSGTDILIGGTGTDVMTGGGGADSFAYDLGSGTDAITDFGLGADTILVDADLGVTEFTDLQILQRGDNTLIRLEPGGADALVLFDTIAADLTADDFVFEGAGNTIVLVDDISEFGAGLSDAPITANAPPFDLKTFDIELTEIMIDAAYDGYDFA